MIVQLRVFCSMVFFNIGNAQLPLDFGLGGKRRNRGLCLAGSLSNRWPPATVGRAGSRCQGAPRNRWQGWQPLPRCKPLPTALFGALVSADTFAGGAGGENGGPAARMTKLKFHSATAVVVANMVGTGVFTSLGFQVAGIPSVFALLMLWVVGGVVALCGALTYAELATALPRSGGEYHFLSQTYHPALGFMAGWVSASVGFAAPTALAAMAFGKYLRTVWPQLPEAHLAAAAVLLVTAVHARSLRLGSQFHDFFTVLKVVLILAFLLAAFFVPSPQPLVLWPTAADWPWLAHPAFAVSLIYVSYAYTGWNAAAYLTGEVADPSRNLPRALVVGTLLVMGLYVLLNFVFLYVVPLPQLSGQLEVGFLAAQGMVGPVGAKAMSGLIALLLVSTISAMVFVGPRIVRRMGEDFVGLGWLARSSARGIPVAGLLFQTGLTLLLIYSSTFEQVLAYASVALIAISSLTVLGVYVLRVRQPGLPRPYRTWGYPFTPGIFLLLNGWTLAYMALNQPHETLVGAGIVLVGLGLYWLQALTARR
jgi:basic amino acid/polyamine antiporter, APA family